MAKLRATADPPAMELSGAMLTGGTPAATRDHLFQDTTHQTYSVGGYGHMRPVPPLPLDRLYQVSRKKKLASLQIFILQKYPHEN